jgi:Asp-tRNA(Asn)/Glu-tRNA(Gln) amidotransferase A subunit family amidase
MSDLHYLSATEALARFRTLELSPVELLEAVLTRAGEVEPTVNALCHTFYEEALDQARAAEARYAGRGEPPRPLEGIPTAVKEEEAIAGQPWTQGSLIYRDLVAPHTSAFARRHLEAGAIVHARTTAPEFSCAGFTHSRLWGVTRPGRRHRGAGQRLGHRRLDPHPRVLQRGGRLQAAVWPGARRPAVQPRHLLSLRADGPHRRRLRAV